MPSRLKVLTMATMLFACASGQRGGVSSPTSLELSRVVLYRNGIGYFERAGDVGGDVLRLKVRRDQVDDLLKSLTVVDRKSGQALSVSMPLDPQTWANAALANLAPGRGSLADVLDQLRGTHVVLHTARGNIRGRIVMVESVMEPGVSTEPAGGMREDHRVTVLDGNDLQTEMLSNIRGVTLRDGDLAMQLHRRLDGSSGEGMFQQIDVAVRLAGKGSHDVMVSYVVAAPMWKPTYRVVLPEKPGAEALLQAWAVVDNISGEDWTDVSMSLTAGEPIAFTYDLHTPRNVTRTDLTEAGVRRRARVAVGETTIGGFVEPGAEQAITADEAEEEDMAIVSESRRMSSKKMMVEDARVAKPESPVDAPAPTPMMDFESIRRSTAASARAETVSGLSRYDLRSKVTVPNGNSTMVAIINDTVDAEETFLFRPGGAGAGYEANPYRVVRFKNSTPFVLEPGPIAIYSNGSFVGEGISETVGTQTSATIPFAVEPTILIDRQVSRQGEEMQLVRLVRGVLEVKSFGRTQTTWTVRGLPKPDGYRVYIRHPKAGDNYQLVERDPEVEDLPDGYLIPVDVAAKAKEGAVSVVEQSPSRTSFSIWDSRVPMLFDQLLVGGNLSPQTRAKLKPIIDLRLAVGRIDTQIDGLRRKQQEVHQLAEGARQNLEAIKKDPAATSLRRELNDRLREYTRDANEIGRELVELQSKRLEHKIKLEDELQTLELDFDSP